MRKIIKNKNLVPVTIADLNLDDSPDLNSTDPVTSRGVATAITEAVGGASDALQEQIDDIAEKAGSGYTTKGEAPVATLNGLSGQENGWLYTMTDAGTLTEGSLAVVAGDTVAWDATNEVWYKAMDYANKNEFNALAEEVNDLSRTGGLVEKKGRFYQIQSVNNVWVNQAVITTGSKDPFGNDTFVMTQSGSTRVSFNVSEHAAGESIGVVYYVDPAYLQKDDQATPISALDTLKFTFVDSSEHELAAISNYHTYINNGWNYVQTKPLSSRCTKVYLQVDGDANTLAYLLGSYVCGRKTKAVLAISYDGGPNQDTYDCGVYDLHESLSLPFSVSGIDTFSQTSTPADKCKELMRKGLMDWAVYTLGIANAADFATAKSALETKLNPVRNGTVSTDMISVCCRYNSNNVMTENVLVSEGFKIFRSLGHRQNMLKDVAGLRCLNVCNMGYVKSGWDSAAETAEINKIKTYIDNIIDFGSWGSIMSHKVVMTSDITPADYGLSETFEVWSVILNYIKSKVDAGDLIVLKISDLWRLGNEG